ncbi:hypothetical protein EYF80_014507 [Liparis tanakae]|uniref:Uncharacterized protein n=1 Tax=Liparis tanakae TaxID=230148 RepID=A0A4Z2IBJ9_9TELE|nr:hypothetical protein EYF80_014507 [Liparis tanakae]
MRPSSVERCAEAKMLEGRLAGESSTRRPDVGGLSRRLWSEIGATQVHNAGGEAQQAPVAVGPVHPGSRRGQTVLLVGTAQQVKGPVLQVGRLLDQLGIQNQVRRR